MNDKVEQWLSWLVANGVLFLTAYYGIIHSHRSALNIFELLVGILVVGWVFVCSIAVLAIATKTPGPKMTIHIPILAATVSDYGLAFLAAAYGHFILAALLIFQNYLEMCYRSYLKGDHKR